ncbi:MULTISPECIES: GNAT family N-acetyltransferase [Nocardioides]|uniref:GNAT family N-acetyltransferase n=1 Tax=Nocardioides vastitatis TaxID=2568655 RepID=A0ABW0ZEG2_9ACTN|nr:GNAT family N-acetyltransferase [Nocardioides sp.]THJ04026.1 GNAT family N-acetyltransferase [Nocardioides sp.]
MLWRVRAGLEDRPGALADLAAACGRAGVNIQTVQVFPEGTTVTDELVLQVPADWEAEQVRGLVESAGGLAVSAARVTEAALEDQPTRYVQATRAIIAQPAKFPEVAAHLFDADVDVADGTEDVLEMTVGGAATIQIRRNPPFTAAERARAAALAELVGQVLESHGPPTPQQPAATSGTDPEFVTADTTVSAIVSGRVTGRACVEEGAGPEHPWPVDLWVDPAWQRRGIGTRLLALVARVARAKGAEEIVLTAPSDTQAVLPMVLAAGMRGRIRMAGDSLTVRIALDDLRR